MGSDDLFKKNRNKRKKRKTFIKDPRDRILIVCEGEKTEPQYFECFGLTNVTVVGTGRNTDSLVEYTIHLKKEAKKAKEPFDKVWCVFDRDSFPAENFNNAFFLAGQNDINIAYTNEAFELWYLLHFHYYDAAISREQYIIKLDTLLDFKYEKNSPHMFDILFDKQTAAIRNAARLLATYNTSNPEKDKPSTTVHLLVHELGRWLQQML